MNLGRKRRGMWPEIVLATAANGALLALFYGIPVPRTPEPPVEIAVDVVQYKPPEPPPELEVPPEIRTVLSGGSGRAERPDGDYSTQLAADAERRTPELEIPAVPPESIAEIRTQVDDIENEMTFYGPSDAAGRNAGNSGRPPGLRTGVSFDARRDPARRGASLRRFGGDEASEGAVEQALAWLAKQQNENGSWGSPASFESSDAAALTSLALLAFLAHGETFDSAAYGDTVSRAADWLAGIAAMPNIEYAGHGFGHAMLTYALAETYAATGSMNIKNSVEKRVASMLERQNKLGSYSPDYDNAPQAAPPDPDSTNPAVRELVLGEPACDLSLLGWHVQALAAARNAGILPEKIAAALDRASGAIVNIHQAAKGGFSQGINLKRFPANPNLTPVGLLALQLLNAGNCEAARGARKLMTGDGMPRWGGGGAFPLYRWYYQTQALFQAEGGAGARWDRWNDNLKEQLLAARKSDGSWAPPAGETGFQLREPDDLGIYATALCTLMLEVYYRYLPGYSIAESDNIRSAAVDELDMTCAGLLAPLPQGVDPMAGLILGLGVTDMKPVRFGIFNGIPAKPDDESVAGEFPLHTTLSSTVPVRKEADWPQVLQPKQRIALFCDEFLPENFKGHLRLTLAVLAAGEPYQESLEVLVNGKRIHFAVLQNGQNLIELLVPSLYLQNFGNLLQIRNTGTSPVAFDAAELGAFTRLGESLTLGAADFSELPPEIRECFNLSVIDVAPGLSEFDLKEAIAAARIAQVPFLLRVHAELPESDFEWLIAACKQEKVCWEFTGGAAEARAARREKLLAQCPDARVPELRTLSGESETQQAMPYRSAGGEYDPSAPLWGRIAAAGIERMGNEFRSYYLCMSGRQVADWIASGGTGIVYSRMLSGGRFFDSLLHTELPAAAALRQYARLFDGDPHRLPLAAYPRYGEKPQWEVSAAAACNAPGNATIVVAKKFPTPVETELVTLVPWNGPTEVTVEKGVLPPDSPFAGMATPLQRKVQSVTVENNVFRISGIWPELAVLRLRQVGAQPVQPRSIAGRAMTKSLQPDKTSCRVGAPFVPERDTAQSLRNASGFFSTAGTKASAQVIPATVVKGNRYPFSPGEDKSVEAVLRLDPGVFENGDSVFLATGDGPDDAESLTFNVFPRLYPDAAGQLLNVPLRFAFGKYCFQVVLESGRWQSVSVPLKDGVTPPYWQAIRILAPEMTGYQHFDQVAYEINGLNVVRKPPEETP